MFLTHKTDQLLEFNISFLIQLYGTRTEEYWGRHTDSMQGDTTASNVRGETGESLLRDEACSLRTK